MPPSIAHHSGPVSKSSTVPEPAPAGGSPRRAGLDGRSHGKPAAPTPLTTRQAANILGDSLPTVVKLIDEGVGTPRQSREVSR